MYEDLKVYRGSTFDCSISLVDRKRNTFLLSDGDKLIFGIKKNLSVDPETGKVSEDIIPFVHIFKYLLIEWIYSWITSIISRANSIKW